MTEEKRPNKPYKSFAFIGERMPFDYTGTAVFQKSTPDEEGIKVEVLHRGYSSADLADPNFTEFCKRSGGTVEQVLNGYLQWRHTKVNWPDTKGHTPETWQKACQAEANNLTLETQRARGETVKVSKAKAAVLSGIEADAAEAGMSVEEYRAVVKAMIAKRTKK